MRQSDLGQRQGVAPPDLEELGTLEAPSNPTDLPTNHPLTAYGKGFATGVNLIPAEKLLPHLFWCVRGGQGVHAQ